MSHAYKTTSEVFIGFLLCLGMLLPGEIASASPPSFRQEIVPILTAAGCSSGGCHGKLAGQNGFRLSLRGYAPEQDYLSLTSELIARRINFAAPSESLLLQKPLGRVPHEGGVRFGPNDRAAARLLEWIEARAPGPDPKESDAVRLEAVPGNRELSVGQTQQLIVRAVYPDGSVNDVTWLSVFYSNDQTVAEVTRGGLIKSVRSGSTSIRAHFQGLVATVEVSTPFPNTVSPDRYSIKNNVIDEHVFARLQALHLPPSMLCDDAAFVRRVYLDVTGSLPTSTEITTFVASKDSEKRPRLIDELLKSPGYVDYWTLQLGDLLQNRKERDHDVRGIKGVRALQDWVREQVAINRPWDQIARDVLLSTGDTTHVPQVGYFIVSIGEKQNVEESELPDAVAMSFLGTRIGCARCHNHPLEKYTQDDFYHFAAYFSRVLLKRQEKEATTLLVGTRDSEELRKQIAQVEKTVSDESSANGSGKTAEESKKTADRLKESEKRLVELRKQLTSAMARAPGVTQPRTGKMMVPQSLDRIVPSWKPGEDPRTALVDWMTNPSNRAFSGNMVNRLWRHYMGVGLVEPVDDLRSSNPPSNPALWAALNQEFVTHQYDLKHVMRLILNSRSYQLSSDTLPENEQDRRFHSHYYARRLPAEVLSDAISTATGVPDQFAGYPIGMRAMQLPDSGVSSYFLTVFGRSERITACACERTTEVTLTQLLHLGNSEAVSTKVRSTTGRLAQLLKEPDDRKVTDELFMSTFGHPASDAELKAIQTALADGDTREEVYRDLFWALLNSKNFAFNH